MINRFIFTLLLVLQAGYAAAAAQTECDAVQENGSDNNHEQNQQQFETQHLRAENLRRRASEAGAEWLETEALLSAAREKATSGNWNPALQLVHKACRQSELALQQAEYESQAWKRRVVD